jgi:hypothetical protein
MQQTRTHTHTHTRAHPHSHPYTKAVSVRCRKTNPSAFLFSCQVGAHTFHSAKPLYVHSNTGRVLPQHCWAGSFISMGNTALKILLYITTLPTVLTVNTLWAMSQMGPYNKCSALTKDQGAVWDIRLGHVFWLNVMGYANVIFLKLLWYNPPSIYSIVCNRGAY